MRLGNKKTEVVIYPLHKVQGIFKLKHGILWDILTSNVDEDQ